MNADARGTPCDGGGLSRPEASACDATARAAEGTFGLDPQSPAPDPSNPDASSDRALRTSGLVAYGALGLPLAFAALPIYVHVPRLYAEGLGLSLALVGAVLLAARVVDAVTDPLIGWANDRLPRRRLWIALALPVLGVGMVGLLAPPTGAGALWLFALLVLVSLAYSVATIAYNAWGAEVGRTPAARTRFVASREAFALVGVVLAAALPGLLAAGELAGLARLAWIFLPLLAGFGLWTLWRAPAPPAVRAGTAPAWAGLRAALGEPAFARLLAVFAANGIAAAIPSATVLFFVADVLQAAELGGLFLVLYFVAAAASLPLWLRVSQRIGKLRAWLASMVLAVAVFAWAGLLGSGDLVAYGLICVLSGFALGADLSLPPSLLADLLARSRAERHACGHAEGSSDGRAEAIGRAEGRAEVRVKGRPAPLEAGACFGWWNFVTKANLALAAGLALPLLAVLGYAPGARDAAATAALAGVYGFVPVMLKFGAIALLWRWRGLIEPALPVAPPLAAAVCRGGEG
jgi:GPH family glycoside/pentoside/hexuronide:cation symporter